MSYCRWSSDNMKSDVYAYEDVVGGITIHVRSSYPVDADKVPDLNIESLINDRSPENQAVWFENKKKRDEIIDNLTWKEHEKPYAGETISVDNENEMIQFFEKLKSYGYHIPKIEVFGITCVNTKERSMDLMTDDVEKAPRTDTERPCMYCENNRGHWECVYTGDAESLDGWENWYCCHICRDDGSPCETFHRIPIPVRQ